MKPKGEGGEMSKRVKVVVVLDSDFVKMLNLSVSMKHTGWSRMEIDKQVTAIDALAIAVLAAHDRRKKNG